MRFHVPAALLLSVALAAPGHARMMRVEYEPIPVPRLLENISAYIEKNPEDAEGYYKLARVHSIAFAKSIALPAEKEASGPSQEAINAILPGAQTYRGTKGLPNFPTLDIVPREADRGPLTDADMEHIRASIRNYAIATRLDPKDAFNWLGYGWMLEQGAPYSRKMGQPWLEKETEAQREGRITDGPTTPLAWLDKARTAYETAFNLGWKNSGKFYKSPAIEAGRYLVAIMKRDNGRTKLEEQIIEKIEAEIDKYEKAPRAVSPIILPLGRSTSLSSLISKNLTSTFDLSNEGLGRRWPWVGSDTGILVWDPEKTGNITSGRQLFGSVTWWVNWKNGYEALGALDDNSDGVLTDVELNGLGIWRDINSNGVSDFGEVKPLSDWGFTSLSVKATHVVKGMPSNLRGATKTDGTVVPTFDWLPKSLN